MHGNTGLKTARRVGMRKGGWYYWQKRWVYLHTVSM